jgi:hypothetical protein
MRDPDYHDEIGPIWTVDGRTYYYDREEALARIRQGVCPCCAGRRADCQVCHGLPGRRPTRETSAARLARWWSAGHPVEGKASGWPGDPKGVG